MLDIDLDNTIFLIDFDGTISKEDTNTKLFEYYINDDIREYREKNSTEDMDYIDFMTGLFNKIDIDENEYRRFILEEIDIMPGYIEFYNKCKKKNIPIGIISGGFVNGIDIFFEKYDIGDVKIFANKLYFNKDGIDISFYHGRDRNCCDIKGCGNCKIKHYDRYKKEYDNIVFIGDGMTDKPLAEVAEIVFAKDSLLDFCKEEDINYIEWNDFFDIIDRIF